MKGDRVFGSSEPALGAHAEYICLPEDGVLTKMPANATWGEAAAIPLAGRVALYFLRDQGNIQAQQRVLINGASGAIGTFAVQLAKYFGPDVTGVCGPENVDMVRSLAADKVIDYTKQDFANSQEAYDVIFDVHAFLQPLQRFAKGEGRLSCHSPHGGNSPSDDVDIVGWRQEDQDRVCDP